MNFSTKTLAKILALSAGCSLVTLAQAANTITFTGKVSDTTCTATIDNGVSSIEMGTSSVADLDTNTYGAAKSFSFTLTGCPKTTEGGNALARVTFGGEADTTNNHPLPALRWRFLIIRVPCLRTILKVRMWIFPPVPRRFLLPLNWLNLVRLLPPRERCRQP